MRSHTEGLLHPFSTARAILRGEARRDGDNGDAMQTPIVADPTEKSIPARIVDAFSKVMVLDEAGYLQVFVGNQVVRRDQRTCGLGREVFTLPADLEGAFRQSFDGFPAVLAALGFAVLASVQPLQALFRFVQIAGVSNGSAFRVGIVGFQSDINANGAVDGLMVYLALCLHCKLAVVAISPLDQPDPFDLLKGKRFNRARANQPDSSNADAISECDTLAIRFQLPA